MNGRIITTLVAKDIKLFFRDKFFGIMTVAGIVAYILFYFLMPSQVDETLEIGLYAPGITALADLDLESEGLIIRNMTSQEELKTAITGRELPTGLAIPGDMQDKLLAGEKPQIFLYFSSDLPLELRETYTLLISEMMNELLGYKLAVAAVEIVLGPDMAGKQIPVRDRMIPLFAFMLLIIETMGLANLLTSELENGTLQALLTTPMKISDLFAGKGLTGILLAFTQATLVMLITGSLAQQTLLILVTLLLGSIMVTGMAFIIAALSKDVMTVMAWSMLFMIAMLIPSFSVMFPGPTSGWIRVLPSFFLVEILHSAVNFNTGWSSNGSNLLILVAFNVVFVSAGILLLRRRVQ